MTSNHIKKLVREMEIDEEGSPTFAAAVIILLGQDKGFDDRIIARRAGYSRHFVATVIGRLKEFGHIIDGKIQMEVDVNVSDYELAVSFVVNLTLLAGVGIGELVNIKVDQDRRPIEVKQPDIKDPPSKPISEEVEDLIKQQKERETKPYQFIKHK